MFSIPVPCHRHSSCYIKKGTLKAELMKRVRLIIWDEVPMQSRFISEAVDRTLRDLLDRENQPFGGIPIAWGGDFQQTLPVIPRGSKEQIVGECLQKSNLWKDVKVLLLKKNMRVDQDDPESQMFAHWLLDVGHGRNLPLDHTMDIPQHMICGPDISDLINNIYPYIDRDQNQSEWEDDSFLERAILCPRNSEVDAINSELLQRFPGESRVFLSCDSAVGNSETEMFPVEYLNSLNYGGMSPSKLEVKLGVPLMLLRNIDPARGLCNGTRVRLIQIRNNVLQVRILTGSCTGQMAFISRIKLISVEGLLPFSLHRVQFPLKLSFAMTINKSQGQSLKTVGLDLRTPVFAHGQLYVAFSRGSSWRRIKVLLEKTKKTTNIVYKEVLLD
jgi:hypothetical protein